MHSFPFCFSKFLRKSTAIAFISISSFPAFAMKEDPELFSQETFRLCPLSPSYKDVPFEFKPTPHVHEIKRDDDGKIRKVITDNNANASYQLESARFAVEGGQKVRIPYNVTVEQGILSLGLLNSARNGWYGDEVVLGPGQYSTFFERIVPESETETALILRNYHLTRPGQTIFAIQEIGIQQAEPPLHSTGIPVCYKNGPHGITVTTDNNNSANYQVKSKSFPVIEGEEIHIPYKITVQPGGIMSCGLLNTAGTGWYDDELILKEGKHEGTYIRIVPSNESHTSVVFRNYHLGQSGQTTFTIEEIDVQKKETHQSLLMTKKTGMGDFFNITSDSLLEIVKCTTLQDVVHLTCTSQTFKALCESPPIWQFLTLKHFNSLPQSMVDIKGNFIAQYCGYDKFTNDFNGDGSLTVKVKHLLPLMKRICPNITSDNIVHPYEFKVNETSFDFKIYIYGMILEPCTVAQNIMYKKAWIDSHLMERLNPESSITFQHYADQLNYHFAQFEIIGKFDMPVFQNVGKSVRRTSNYTWGDQYYRDIQITIKKKS